MLSLAQLPAIETPSVCLRELRHGDAKELASFMTQVRYQRFISHRLRNEFEVQDFVARQIASQNDAQRRVFHLVAEERFSAEVVGDGFLIRHEDQSLEIGWGLHPALWRAGFGTEIGHGLMGLGFEKLKAKKMWCKVMRPNVASARLAKRIGMELVEQRPHMAVGHGRFEDVDVFAIEQDRYYDLPYLL
jgi:ribosomal-protein-alanine N-acetyltransferase